MSAALPGTDFQASLYAREERRALLEEAARIQKARIELARVDYNEFAEYVLKDEQSGQPLIQAPMHELWTDVRRKHDRACIIAHVEAGKTQQFSVGVPLFELGRNPRARFAVVSRTHKQATKIIRTAAKYIVDSPELHHVYPALKPGERWSDKGLFVERDGAINEPSLQALGFKGAISGARLDGVILDDFLDSTNTRTEGRRDDTEDWFFSEIFSRLTDEAWVYFIGNAWHPDDLYCRLEDRGWPTFRFPVVVTPELAQNHPAITAREVDGGYGKAIGDPTWPERWPAERIAKRRKEVPPIEFARAQMCQPRDDKDARFKRGWIDTALEKGSDLPPTHTLTQFLQWDDPEYAANDELAADWVRMVFDPDDDGPFWVTSGLDLSTGKSDDLSAITTIAIDRLRGKRFLLDCVAGRWQVDEILNRVVDVHARYGSMFLVENNATQDYIVQLIQKRSAIPVFPFTTGTGKADPRTGMELLAAEFWGEKWIIPSKNGEGATEDIHALVKDMLFYDPDPKAHTGDRLMSLWFAQIMARRLERRAQRKDDDDGLVVI